MSGQHPSHRKIVAAVDGSEESSAAARYAIELAKLMNTEVVLLHVIQLPQYVSDDVRNRLKDELSLRAQSALSAIRQAAEGSGVSISGTTLYTTGSVVDTICEFAKSEDGGMVVMGTRGIGGMAKVMLGSVAAGVVRSASCPVLVVR